MVQPGTIAAVRDLLVGLVKRPADWGVDLECREILRFGNWHEHLARRRLPLRIIIAFSSVLEVGDVFQHGLRRRYGAISAVLLFLLGRQSTQIEFRLSDHLMRVVDGFLRGESGQTDVH